MNINGSAYRTIWLNDDGWSVSIIDQTRLPHEFVTVSLTDLAEAAHAIKAMLIRGAPLVGATAAYGMCLALRDDPSDRAINHAYDVLYATRPTAVNLRWALDEMRETLQDHNPESRIDIAYQKAAEICDDDVKICQSIGDYGVAIIRDIAALKPTGETVNILTHCNAGWLATVDWGTATAPIYMAHDEGIKIHVWVGETRPRNQGASLTAYELGQHGVPHTVIVDNTGGHLMQHGLVDLCIVGTDRTAANGDVGNKIGTYLKALAAKDNNIPFYVALPSTTIDWTIHNGVTEIPIEQRSGEEVSQMTGRNDKGAITTVTITPENSPVANYAFDVTPARLVSGLITERGVAEASTEGLLKLFPEQATT